MMRRALSLARVSRNLSHLPCTSRQFAISSRRSQHVAPALTRNDETLINRGDFVGVRPTTIKADRNTTPENVIALLQHQFTRNARINGEKFMMGILLPLEAAKEQPNAFSEAFKRSPDRFAPFAVSLCGSTMSDVSSTNKLVMLDRLWSAYENLGIPITVEILNERISVWLQNNHNFDPSEVLQEIEMKYKLEPNAKTFSMLLRQLAFSGKGCNAESWEYEMAKHGIVRDLDIHCSMILCAAGARDYTKTELLVEQSVEKYGDSARRSALGAAMVGSAAANDITRLRKLLRKAVIISKDNDKRRHVLEVDYPVVFDVIWLLAKNSAGADGKEYTALCEQILEHTIRTKGFFKYLVREADRHIAHEYYYTAVPILVDTLRVQDCLKNQKKDSFVMHMLPRMCNQMIRKGLPVECIKEVCNRVSASFGAEYRFYDNLLYAILTYREYTPFEKYEMLEAFIDVVDPDRDRIHLTLPLLTACTNTQDRLKMIYRISKILGYPDISLLDTRVMSRLFLYPMMDYYDDGRNAFEARLDTLARVFKSYGVSAEATWKLVFNWWKYRCSINEGNERDNNDMSNWLQYNYAEIFESTKKTTKTSEKPPDFATFASCVADGDYERVHSTLQKYGWPKDTDFNVITPQLLDLYLESADWGCTTRMLNLLSAACNRFSESEEHAYPVKNYHLLNIMRRRIVENSGIEVSTMIDYAYELRRMFPKAVAEYATFMDTIHASHRLFSGVLFNSLQQDRNVDLTVGSVDKIIDLLVTLIKLDMVTLHMNETLTSSIVATVLNSLGWNAAVDTWLKFQSTLYLSNGMISLLKYSIGRSQNRNHTQFVLHKSKSFLSQSRANAIYLAALVAVKREDEGEKFLAAGDHGIKPLDAVHVFRLLNAINYKSYDERFVVSFARLCLQYTDLMEDKMACEIFHNDWLKMCETKRLGQLPLELYDLFKSFGRPLDHEQMKRVWKLSKEHNNLTKKWLFGNDRLLNVTEESKKQYRENFESRFQALEEQLNNPKPTEEQESLSSPNSQGQLDRFIENVAKLQLMDEEDSGQKAI
uniref:Leucine-rich PPR motif-containing protein, mitochondrial n=1 Tax=Steinernema glaseri TaxID=37863 RepID=A0A1I7YD84_9BILA